MKVFVKYYWMAKGKITVNQWCDVNKDDLYNMFIINSGNHKDMAISREDFLTVQDIRKQKINKIYEISSR